LGKRVLGSSCPSVRVCSVRLGDRARAAHRERTEGREVVAVAEPALRARNGVRSAQAMPVGPCIPVGIKLETAEVGPTSGPTWRLSHLLHVVRVETLRWSADNPPVRAAKPSARHHKSTTRKTIYCGKRRGRLSATRKPSAHRRAWRAWWGRLNENCTGLAQTAGQL
jgi:hypothetical protein